MARHGVVKHSAEVPCAPVAAGTATETAVLIGPDDGAPNFAMRRFTMGEGGGMPRHTNLVEHEQYVVRGRARITVGDTVHEVAEGDVLLIPGRHAALLRGGAGAVRVPVHRPEPRGPDRPLLIQGRRGT